MADPAIEQFAELLRPAREVLVITGAGISADSGLPTYRGIGGLYEDRNTEEGYPIEEALSATVFNVRPEVTWKYLAQIEAGKRDARPNAAHEILAAWESRLDRMWILTQNVDGFHSLAGSRNVIEIHGNLHRLRCTRCPYQTTVENYEGLAIPPSCPDCERMIRPDVVLFEEQLPLSAIDELTRQLNAPLDLVISIGTSNHFPYITQPIYQSHRSGIPTVEINPSTTAISDFVTLKLRMGAREALTEVERLIAPSALPPGN